MLKERFDNLRARGALIHNITNYVTVNDVANVILASGASPIMSDDVEDAPDITQICGGLNINIGTLNQRTIPAMFASGKRANELGHVVLLDPVGAGASKLRTETAAGLMEQVRFDVIRGNISEIKSLALGSSTTQGVDANVDDAVTESNLSDMVSFAKRFAASTGSIVAITGAIDLVADAEHCYVIRNGRPEMGRITGTGCQLSGMMTAFLVANADTADAGADTAEVSEAQGEAPVSAKLEAAAAAVCTMGLAGEIAWDRMQDGDGNSTYRNRIIDAIYNMTGDDLEKGAKYEIR